ncbi:hypothetical protein ACMFMF_007124 [Clarireedia jacksonii]
MDIEMDVAKVDSSMAVGLYHSSNLLLDLPTYHPSTLRLGSFGDDILDFDFTMSDAPRWSPIDERCEDFPGMLEISQESDSGEIWNKHSSRQSVASSCFTDNSSSILTPSNYGSMSESSRSSGMSYGSSYTWDTSSMLISVDEHPNGLLEEPASLSDRNILGISQVYKSPYETDEPSKVATHQRSVPDGVGQQSANAIPRRHGSIDRTPPQSANTKSKPSVNVCMKNLPKLPEKERKYCCTACPTSFSSKGDWKRHEGSQCEPQRLWYCMLLDAAVRIQNTWFCILCHNGYRDRESMNQHLKAQHKLHLCVNKSLEKRSHKRKDKLKEHLQKHHGLAEGCTGWENWYQDAPPKRAWGCGFCGACLINWNGQCHLLVHSHRHRLPKISSS